MNIEISFGAIFHYVPQFIQAQSKILLFGSSQKSYFDLCRVAPLFWALVFQSVK